MSDYYGGFYEWEGEFDEEIEKLKDALQHSVKKTIVDELNALRVENEELQEIKRNWKQLEDEHKSAIRELEREKSNCFYNAKKERLESLMEDNRVIMYRVGNEYIRQEKCEHCDENRKLSFVKPDGSKVIVSCSCDKHIAIPVVEELVLYRFSYRYGNFRMYYKRAKFEEGIYELEDISSNCLETVYKEGMKFEDLDSRSMYFENKEDCQKYCDWLKEKKESK